MSSQVGSEYLFHYFIVDENVIHENYNFLFV